MFGKTKESNEVDTTEVEADAFFGLGFVHAQDRLAQMLWLVRAARGRTAARPST